MFKNSTFVVLVVTFVLLNVITNDVECRRFYFPLFSSGKKIQTVNNWSSQTLTLNKLVNKPEPYIKNSDYGNLLLRPINTENHSPVKDFPGFSSNWDGIHHNHVFRNNNKSLSSQHASVFYLLQKEDDDVLKSIRNDQLGSRPIKPDSTLTLMPDYDFFRKAQFFPIKRTTKKETPTITHTQTEKANAPSSNIGPKGYPVQKDINYKPSYNTAFQSERQSPNGFNPDAPNRIQPNGYSSYHGLTSNYYPTHNNFGYASQGFHSGDKSPQYGGMKIFNDGSSGSYGYPTSGNWGYTSYGTGMYKPNSGKDDLLTGFALGDASNSLVRRVSNPWKWDGHGYGYSDDYHYPYITDINLYGEKQALTSKDSESAEIHRKRHEIYSQLEKIVFMGKFT